LNNLKDENYIFVGQNLIISESTENLTKQLDLINNYHIVLPGENLTEISNKYDLKVIDLIEINNLNNPDSIKVGQKLTIRKKNTINSEKYETTENKKNNDLIELDKKIYGINTKSKSASEIIFSLIPYIETHLSNGGKSWDICKHLINLVEGIPKAKIWRNQISNKSIKKELNIEYLLKLTTALEEMGY